MPQSLNLKVFPTLHFSNKTYGCCSEQSETWLLDSRGL